MTKKPNLDVFGLWEEAGVPKYTGTGENMQSLHRKAGLNPERWQDIY